jgi:hypothetical protein
MIQQQSELSSRDANGDGMVGNGSSRPALKPQHWSNAVWAVASAQCYNGHEELLNFIARLFEDDPDFVRNFKSQELTNTVWAVATIISNMP